MKAQAEQKKHYGGTCNGQHGLCIGVSDRVWRYRHDFESGPGYNVSFPFDGPYEVLVLREETAVATIRRCGPERAPVRVVSLQLLARCDDLSIPQFDRGRVEDPGGEKRPLEASLSA